MELRLPISEEQKRKFREYQYLDLGSHDSINHGLQEMHEEKQAEYQKFRTIFLREIQDYIGVLQRRIDTLVNSAIKQALYKKLRRLSLSIMDYVTYSTWYKATVLSVASEDETKKELDYIGYTLLAFSNGTKEDLQSRKRLVKLWKDDQKRCLADKSFEFIQQAFLDIEQSITQHSTLIDTVPVSSNHLSIDRKNHPQSFQEAFTVAVSSSEGWKQKLGRMSARVDNLINKRCVDEEKRGELQLMMDRLSSGEFPNADNAVRELQTKIEALLSSQTPQSAKTTIAGASNDVDTRNLQIKIVTTDENKEAINKINTILENLNYKLSSTRTGSDSSFGDGSFLKQIFRPFLNALILMLEKNKISPSFISWKEIAELYAEEVQDNDNARRGFIGTLKQFSDRGTFEYLLTLLPDILGGFGNTNYYNKQDAREPLQNIINALSAE